MTQLPHFIKEAGLPKYPYRFSICTLVTRYVEYIDMVDSFINAGFTSELCEYLMIDNSVENKMDAYEGINTFLKIAQGEYIIICHQDIVLTGEAGFELLNQRIAEMDQLDARWAVLGNAGSIDRLYKKYAIKIAYPNNTIDIKGTLPQAVCSIDENFMLVKNRANLALSSDLKGYHFYGLDLCLIARTLGFSSYAIEFLLIHKSKGKVDPSFNEISISLQKKYQRVMQGRYVNTTMTGFYLSGSALRNSFFETLLIRKIVKYTEKLKWLLKS